MAELQESISGGQIKKFTSSQRFSCEDINCVLASSAASFERGTRESSRTLWETLLHGVLVSSDSICRDALQNKVIKDETNGWSRISLPSWIKSGLEGKCTWKPLMCRKETVNCLLSVRMSGLVLAAVHKWAYPAGHSQPHGTAERLESHIESK